jgi:hypothetical protein
MPPPRLLATTVALTVPLTRSPDAAERCVFRATLDLDDAP